MGTEGLIHMMTIGDKVRIMDSTDKYFGKVTKIYKMNGLDITLKVSPWAKQIYRARQLKLVSKGE